MTDGALSCRKRHHRLALVVAKIDEFSNERPTDDSAGSRGSLRRLGKGR